VAACLPLPAVGAKAAPILPGGQITYFPVQPHLQKYFPSRLTQITGLFPPSHPSEGRIAIVTDAGWVRWTRIRCGRAALMRTAKTRGPDAPTLVSSWRDFPAGDGGKKARSPGRARYKPLKPPRGECRAFSGVTVVTNARAYYHYTRGCGRIGRPAFPAPSDWRDNVRA
jgi:hypothetical protein